MNYYFEQLDTIYEALETSHDGLDPTQASNRLQEVGPNKLDEGKKKTIFMRFMSQLADPMIIILIAAATISGVVGEIADTIIIMIVVVLNSILGVVQEGKAEKAIEALQEMSSPFTKVRRVGHIITIPSEEIVPGDIVLLEAGDAIAADMRIIESSSIKIEEASLTGESVPVNKFADVLEFTNDDITLGDRKNMAYMGTNVVYGRGEGVVVATGMQTEMGNIANIISQTVEEKTPLQKKLAGLSKVLSIGVLLICVFIFAYGVLTNGGFRGSHVLELFLLAISLAVAAIPEGLVAVVTIVLSIGVTKMSKRNAIIRRLTAVETLGCTQVICSDKTGTLTQNQMTVVETYGKEKPLATAMTLCNDSYIEGDQDEVFGEPTESALVTYALKLGLHKSELEETMPRVAEAPFDSSRKMMSTIHDEKNGRYIQYTKGAPDVLIEKCTQILTEDGNIKPLDEETMNALIAENTRMTDEALRVLAASMRIYETLPEDTEPKDLEHDLIFIGLAGMIDPVRPEVKDAIDKCREAQIRPIMITGDHINTAVAIAKQLDILEDEKNSITGSELAKLSDDQFDEVVDNYCVYARVQPEHKVRIVETWKKKHMVTAMTGDGVNDAPALKTANIGIGMGITGTDVTKNVSDMVLADDNFATIVAAVEEGRRIYDNIIKAIQFLLSSNFSEVVALFVATVMNFIIFSPPQILWINLVTDSFPAIALGMEEAEPDIMQKAPRDENASIFADGLGINVIYQGTIIAILTLLAYYIGNGYSFMADGALHEAGMTMAFITLSMSEIFHSINMRSVTKSIFRLPTSNKYLIWATLLSFVLTVAVVYTPGINEAFELVALPFTGFLTAMLISASIIPIVEIVKAVVRSAKKKKQKV